jgi:hypothetical protein
MSYLDFAVGWKLREAESNPSRPSLRMRVKGFEVPD